MPRFTLFAAFYVKRRKTYLRKKSIVKNNLAYVTEKSTFSKMNVHGTFEY